jgi:hypothetical protein
MFLPVSVKDVAKHHVSGVRNRRPKHHNLTQCGRPISSNIWGIRERGRSIQTLCNKHSARYGNSYGASCVVLIPDRNVVVQHHAMQVLQNNNFAVSLDASARI